MAKTYRVEGRVQGGTWERAAGESDGVLSLRHARRMATTGMIALNTEYARDDDTELYVESRIVREQTGYVVSRHSLYAE